jgi:hypothetical protein
MTSTRFSTLPTPKHAIGDVVFAWEIIDSQERKPCPDCRETGKWTATSLAGTSVDVECPRCSGRTCLSQRDHSYRVRQLTIGSIRIDTAPHEVEDAVMYMCLETGIGSGSLWNESKLFLDSREAGVEGQLRVCILNEGLDKQSEGARERFRYLSQYKIEKALAGEAMAERDKWRHSYRRLIERICELETAYLIQPKEFEGDGLTSMSLDSGIARLVQEHLMAYDTEGIKALQEWRSLPKED